MDDFDLYDGAEPLVARKSPEFTESSFMPTTQEDNIPESERSLIERNPALEGALSYEQDIQPLKKEYFRATYGSGMRGDRARQMFAQRSGEVTGMFNEEMKARNNEMQLYRGQAAYESTINSLTRAREDAARERRMASEMQPIQAELDSILNDPSITREEATRLTGGLAVKYGAMIASNPGVAAAFNGMTSALSSYKKQEEEGVSFAVMMNRSPAVAGQAAQAFTAMYGREPTDQDRLPIAVYGSLIAAETQRKTDQASLSKRNEEDRKRFLDRQTGLFKRVDDVEFKTDITGEIKDPPEFATPQDEQSVIQIIKDYGSDEQKTAADAAMGDPRTLLEIASAIRNKPSTLTPPELRSPIQQSDAGSPIFN